jgi:hypothetical protein
VAFGKMRPIILCFYKSAREKLIYFFGKLGVPDKRSRDLKVVEVRCAINLGTGNLEWGGNGEGLRKGRSVYE